MQSREKDRVVESRTAVPAQAAGLLGMSWCWRRASLARVYSWSRAEWIGRISEVFSARGKLKVVFVGLYLGFCIDMQPSLLVA